MEEISTNLFDYATSELSQDAFICWLVSWIEHKEKSEELYNAARDFLNMIFYKKGINENNFEIERIKKQEDYCDILIEMKNGYYIIIEDKINCDEHEAGKTGKPQLKAYKEKIADNYKIKENKIITVFYKIFNYDEDSVFADVKINRKDMLDILNKRNTVNEIYEDYKSKVNSIENTNKKLIAETKKIPVMEWKNSEQYSQLISSFYYNSIITNPKISDSLIRPKKSSVYIDWQRKKVSAKEIFNTTMDFNIIHLALDINGKKAYIYLKATIEKDDNYEEIKAYNNEDRKEIQGKFETFFEKKLGKYCFKKHSIYPGKWSFRIVTIDVAKLCGKETLMEDHLIYAVNSITAAYEEFFKN